MNSRSLTYRSRSLEQPLLQASRQFPVILVTGPRQTGKTTLLRKLDRERTYITLDDPLLRELAQRDPSLFLQRYSGPLLIDEIQYAPELLPFLKIRVDAHREPGMFWLTGSQQFHLMKGVSESLAGRLAVVRLLGFSQAEIHGDPQRQPFLPDRPISLHSIPDLAAIYRQIWTGSFPALHGEQHPDRDLFLSSYVQTYLQRDVRDLARVGDESSYLRFMRVCAARSGQLLNIADLSRDADIAQATAKHWLSILEASGIIHLLQPFHSNLTQRLVKAPKLYFLDTGLATWLTGWSSPETLESGAMSGAILETWVVSEVLKSYWHRGLDAPLWYFRDRDQKEIDMLLVRDGTIHPVEVKKSAQPGRDAIRQFQALDKFTGSGLLVGKGAIVCFAAHALPMTDSVDIVPVGTI